MADFVLALTTIPDDGRADTLARALVEERLAACVNVLPPMRSTYRWKGAVQDDAERQVIIKTTTAHVQALERRLRELHPYEVPEFLVMPIVGGGAAYLAWMTESLSDT